MLIALGSTLCLAACGGTSGDAQPPTPTTSTSVAARGEPYLGPLRFDWPSSCSVGVTEQVTKNSVRGTLAYRLKTSQHAEGLALSFADKALLEVNGQTVPAAQLRRLTAAYRLPDSSSIRTARWSGSMASIG